MLRGITHRKPYAFQSSCVPHRVRATVGRGITEHCSGRGWRECRLSLSLSLASHGQSPAQPARSSTLAGVGPNSHSPPVQRVRQGTARVRRNKGKKQRSHTAGQNYCRPDCLLSLGLPELGGRDRDRTRPFEIFARRVEHRSCPCFPN